MRGGRKYFGEGLGYLDISKVKGHLIVLEGTDGVGRSTQMELLQSWLEVKGFGVVTTGWTRSNLMSRSIEMIKQGNMVDGRTYSLLYATDFADRLENQIIPALRSGFVVLADRYVYTAWVRDMVRSGGDQWIKDVLSFGLIPDLVMYLRVDVDTLIHRVIEFGGMNYWESGMDLNLADNIYDSFRKYQMRLIKTYDEVAKEQGFEIVDARKDVMTLHEKIRQKVAEQLKIEV
ncbi:MAG: thymidylate kinase [Deltaproteobacteria bacterium]|nr:thymidylate kinase [Deltaproteobacteria bacterium]